MGPFQGKTILVSINAHSKWNESVCIPPHPQPLLLKNYEHYLLNLVSRRQLSLKMAQDSPVRSSRPFSRTIVSHILPQRHTIQHQTGWPRELFRLLRNFKGLEKVKLGTMSCHLAQVLFTYCTTPQTTTGISPTKLLLGRRLRTHLDLLRPNIAARVERKQQAQKRKHDTYLVTLVIVESQESILSPISTEMRLCENSLCMLLLIVCISVEQLSMCSVCTVIVQGMNTCELTSYDTSLISLYSL